jgi:transcriptional regulator with XRE-family HTH domain
MSAERDLVAIRIGKSLLSHRKQAGISQDELARRASLHRLAVGMLERGERVPRVDTLIKIASVLSVPPGALLTGISWEPGNIQPGEFRLGNSENGPAE